MSTQYNSHCFSAFACNFNEYQLGTQRTPQMNFQALGHQLATRSFGVWRASIFVVQQVALVRIQPGKSKAMINLFGDGASKREDYALAARGFPVFESIPVHAVRPVRHMKELRVADKRTQPELVKCDGV